MSVSDGKHIIHGANDDALYVDEELRRCATCNQIKDLRQFFLKPTTSEVNLNCRQCVKEMKELEVAQRAQKADTTLVSTLQKANARRALLDPAPRMSDGVKTIAQTLGGHEKASRRAGRAIGRAMKAKDEDVARKAGMAYMSLIAAAEKNQNESFDLNSLSAEDRIDILMEPAKELLLRDPEFRRVLLNDPEVRDLLLLDSGIKLIEAK